MSMNSKNHQNIIERIKKINKTLGIENSDDIGNDSVIDKLDRIENKVDKVLLGINKVTENDLVNKESITKKYNYSDIRDGKIIIDELNGKYIYKMNINFRLNSEEKQVYASQLPDIRPYGEYKLDLEYDVKFRNDNIINISSNISNTEYNIDNIISEISTPVISRVVKTYKNYTPGNYTDLTHETYPYNGNDPRFTFSNPINSGNIVLDNKNDRYEVNRYNGSSFSRLTFKEIESKRLVYSSYNSTIHSAYFSIDNNDTNRKIKLNKKFRDLTIRELRSSSDHLLYYRLYLENDIVDNSTVAVELESGHTEENNNASVQPKINPIYVNIPFEIDLKKFKFNFFKLLNIESCLLKEKENINNWENGKSINYYQVEYKYNTPTGSIYIHKKNTLKKVLTTPGFAHPITDVQYIQDTKNYQYSDTPYDENDIEIEVRIDYGEFYGFN